MRLVVVAVGKPRHAGLAAAISDYEERAARYWPLEIHEVREESSRSTPPDLVREREGKRLGERVPKDARVIACDGSGERMTSPSFADLLRRARDEARTLAFVIGGALGLDPAFRAGAGTLLALAPWTLPHELARLVLAEQIYRAGTIVRGEPYHK
ncbi:MAG: 23S rRNA (pseudouridine(1915)-N(3))-methyltransferase RlmH [Gemmatimonadaceae bacterium]